jgi:hypothetical protein
MIGKALWRSLKELVAYDQELVQKSATIIEKKKNISELHQKITDLTQQLTQLKESAFSSQKEVDMLQLQANSLHDNEKHKRELLENVKDQREYMALEKELSSLTQKRHVLDEATLKSWHQIELVQQKYQDALDNYERLQKEHKDSIAQLERDILELEGQINECEKKREAHELTIPEEWRVRYHRMRNQVTDPIVHVHETSCSSCFYAVLHQDVIRLKKQGILPCRNCYRLLYYDENQEEQDHQAHY